MSEENNYGLFSISICFGPTSIGTFGALGNCKGGNEEKNKKDDEGREKAVLAESHPEPVLKTKCLLIHIDHGGGLVDILTKGGFQESVLQRK